MKYVWVVVNTDLGWCNVVAVLDYNKYTHVDLLEIFGDSPEIHYQKKSIQELEEFL